MFLYKINRRPLGGPTLFEDLYREAMPPSALRHVFDNLTQVPSVAESGRRYKRLWQVGNVEVNDEDTLVIGRLGWARSGTTLGTYYDPKTRVWVDREVPDDVSAVAPFALIAEGRFLGVLRHPSFTPEVVAQVFRDLLNDAERQIQSPTTEWDVEPVGDESEFFDWLGHVDQVNSVEFVFKRPNPDAEDAFAELYERQRQLRADELRETIKTSNMDAGLDKQALREDTVSRMFLAAAMAAYGYVIAHGRRAGRDTSFDQRSRVARERTENVGPSWEDAARAVLDATLRGRRRRRQDG